MHPPASRISLSACLPIAAKSIVKRQSRMSRYELLANKAQSTSGRRNNKNKQAHCLPIALPGLHARKTDLAFGECTGAGCRPR